MKFSGNAILEAIGFLFQEKLRYRIFTYNTLIKEKIFVVQQIFAVGR